MIILTLICIRRPRRLIGKDGSIKLRTIGLEVTFTFFTIGLELTFTFLPNPQWALQGQKLTRPGDRHPANDYISGQGQGQINYAELSEFGALCIRHEGFMW